VFDAYDLTFCCQTAAAAAIPAEAIRSSIRLEAGLQLVLGIVYDAIGYVVGQYCPAGSDQTTYRLPVRIGYRARVSVQTEQLQREPANTNAPTRRTSTSVDAASDDFNRTVFDGQLPGCLITVERHEPAFGYFSGERFANAAWLEEVSDEIALNPGHFADRAQTQTLLPVVDEMVRLWQHHFGQPSRNGYHNSQWAAKKNVRLG
jgi:hypothetical protein